jgi:peptidoglycan/xylan/chitin deacetylase (PgdA/CDA1 family)
LDFAAARDVRLTLFQVGLCVQRFPDVTKRADRDGHVIGSHTLSHTFSHYFQPSAVRHEIEENQKILEKALGKTPLLFRAPWFFHTPTLRRTLRSHAMQPILGALPHHLESLQPHAAHMARHALAQARPGAILIFHDGNKSLGGNRSQSIEAAKITIDALLQQGYTLVTVDKLLGLPAYAEPAENGAGFG